MRGPGARRALPCGRPRLRVRRLRRRLRLGTHSINDNTHGTSHNDNHDEANHDNTIRNVNEDWAPEAHASPYSAQGRRIIIG